MWGLGRYAVANEYLGMIGARYYLGIRVKMTQKFSKSFYHGNSIKFYKVYMYLSLLFLLVLSVVFYKLIKKVIFIYIL